VAAVELRPESDWPERLAVKRRKRDRDFERQVDALIQSRDQAAGKLDIEPSLIASRSVLEGLVAGELNPDSALLSWQRDCLALAQ
jgi:hypothetical protein